MVGDGEMRTSEVADLFGVDRSNISRLDRSDLPYTTTPGGHRRYKRVDVLRYGREVMGLEMPGEGPEG